MFIKDNGESFTQAQLDAIKRKLNARLTDVDQNTDKWWEIVKAFLNNLSRE
jgi:hypothetical protein